MYLCKSNEYLYYIGKNMFKQITLIIKTCIYILSETRQNIILSNETFVECGGAGVQKKIVFVEGDKTSSALIIMGIFFIVVVIGLFYYLPQWSPGKVIIHRSRDGVSLIEQDIIE